MTLADDYADSKVVDSVADDENYVEERDLL